MIAPALRLVSKKYPAEIRQGIFGKLMLDNLPATTIVATATVAVVGRPGGIIHRARGVVRSGYHHHGRRHDMDLGRAGRIIMAGSIIDMRRRVIAPADAYRNLGTYRLAA